MQGERVKPAGRGRHLQHLRGTGHLSLLGAVRRGHEHLRLLLVQPRQEQTQHRGGLARIAHRQGHVAGQPALIGPVDTHAGDGHLDAVPTEHLPENRLLNLNRLHALR